METRGLWFVVYIPLVTQVTALIPNLCNQRQCDVKICYSFPNVFERFVYIFSDLLHVRHDSVRAVTGDDHVRHVPERTR